MSCGVGHRLGSDPMLLWLWRRPATAPIRPLAWEPPYAAKVALENSKKTKQTNKQPETKRERRVFVDNQAGWTGIPFSAHRGTKGLGAGATEAEGRMTPLRRQLKVPFSAPPCAPAILAPPLLSRRCRVPFPLRSLLQLFPRSGASSPWIFAGTQRSCHPRRCLPAQPKKPFPLHVYPAIYFTFSVALITISVCLVCLLSFVFPTGPLSGFSAEFPPSPAPGPEPRLT